MILSQWCPTPIVSLETVHCGGTWRMKSPSLHPGTWDWCSAPDQKRGFSCRLKLDSTPTWSFRYTHLQTHWVACYTHKNKSLGKVQPFQICSLCFIWLLITIHFNWHFELFYYFLYWFIFVYLFLNLFSVVNKVKYLASKAKLIKIIYVYIYIRFQFDWILFTF